MTTQSIQKAAEALVKKLILINDNPSYQSIWGFAAIHGMPYTGPDFAKEVKALQDALDQAHKPVYKEGTTLFHILQDGWSRGFDPAQTEQEAKSSGYSIDKVSIGKVWEFMQADMERDMLDKAIDTDKPVDCSGDPTSCPDNEGRGCHCSDIASKTETSNEINLLIVDIGKLDVLSAAIERSRGANCYARNETAVNEFVNLQADVFARLRGLCRIEDYENMRKAYENMRDFAISKGLDVTTHG